MIKLDKSSSLIIVPMGVKFLVISLCTNNFEWIVIFVNLC